MDGVIEGWPACVVGIEGDALPVRGSGSRKHETAHREHGGDMAKMFRESSGAQTHGVSCLQAARYLSYM
jgi:hypothetical protein